MFLRSSLLQPGCPGALGGLRASASIAPSPSRHGRVGVNWQRGHGYSLPLNPSSSAQSYIDIQGTRNIVFCTSWDRTPGTILTFLGENRDDFFSRNGGSRISRPNTQKSCLLCISRLLCLATAAPVPVQGLLWLLGYNLSACPAAQVFVPVLSPSPANPCILENLHHKSRSTSTRCRNKRVNQTS